MLFSMKTNTKLPQWLSGGLLALAMGLLPFGVAYGQDYDAVERRLGVAVGDGEITLPQAQAMMRTLRATSEEQKFEKWGTTSALRADETQTPSLPKPALQADETQTPAVEIATEDLRAAIKKRLHDHDENLRKQLVAGEITREEMKVKLKAAERQVWEQYRKFEHYGIGPN